MPPEPAEPIIVDPNLCWRVDSGMRELGVSPLVSDGESVSSAEQAARGSRRHVPYNIKELSALQAVLQYFIHYASAGINR